MNQQDPLALLRQERNGHVSQKEKRETNGVHRRKTRVRNNATIESSNERISIKEGLIISLIVLIIVLLTVGILLARDNGWI